jgi:hypothetical protein
VPSAISAERLFRVRFTSRSTSASEAFFFRDADRSSDFDALELAAFTDADCAARDFTELGFELAGGVAAFASAFGVVFAGGSLPRRSESGGTLLVLALSSSFGGCLGSV